jgi:hypothetical protein
MTSGAGESLVQAPATAPPQAVMSKFSVELIPCEWHQGNSYSTAKSIGLLWPRCEADQDKPYPATN